MSNNEHPHEPDRRDDVRVELALSLRVRPVGERPPEVDALIEDYEELGRLAQRFRREASPSGRKFLSKLMDVLDGLTARAEDTLGNGWSPRTVIEASLSAGGLGFASGSPLAEGAIVDVEFVVSPPFSRVPFRSVGRVVRCDPREDGEHEIGLAFVEMRPGTRDRLLRMVFDAQRLDLRARSEER